MYRFVNGKTLVGLHSGVHFMAEAQGRCDWEAEWRLAFLKYSKGHIAVRPFKIFTLTLNAFVPSCIHFWKQFWKFSSVSVYMRCYKTHTQLLRCAIPWEGGLDQPLPVSSFTLFTGSATVRLVTLSRSPFKVNFLSRFSTQGNTTRGTHERGLPEPIWKVARMRG